MKKKGKAPKGVPRKSKTLLGAKFRFKKRYSSSLIAAVILIAFVVLYWRSGIFQEDKIDLRDLKVWERDADGIVVGAKEFVVEGNKETCWLMIHGFTASPNEMIELSERINSEFGDYVYAMRLKGHGEVPSKIIDLSLEDWYEQVDEEFENLNSKCENVNIVGFSFGGALATRLAEEKKLKNVYLLAPYVYARYKVIRIFKLETYLDLFAEMIGYSKKTKLAQINDPEGLKSYISYWNFPVVPVLKSQLFLIDLVKDLNKIDEPILIQHSKNDDTADILSSRIIFETIISEDKEFVIFERSNHVLLFDYDKEEVINNIIEFESERR